jgi:septal ring factor EnvC (AmiA/AmiB activator)
MRLTAELEQAQQGMVRLDAELASQKKHYERMFDEQFFEQRTLNDKLTAENAELREANSIAAEYVHRVEVAEKERDELRARLDEITSYMPKVPTEPYEKRLAKEHSAALEVKLEK